MGTSGAVPGGSLCHTQIQAALDYAGPRGLDLEFGLGDYYIGQTVNNSFGVMLRSRWSDVANDGSGSGSEACRILWSGANGGTMIYHGSTTLGKVVIGGGYDGIVLDGYDNNPSGNAAGIAIHFQGAQHSRIGRLKIRNVDTHGVWYDDYVSGTDGAISASNYIDDLDFVMGFWTGSRLIGASANAVYYHGSSFSQPDATAYGGVTRNLFNKIRGSIYNGHVVKYRFADNNHGVMVHTIGLGAGVWGAAGTGRGVYFQTTDSTPPDTITSPGHTLHSAYGFPAGNVVENVNGEVYVEDYTHGNIVKRVSSESGSVVINDITKGHINYGAFDFVTLREYHTESYPMTDVQSFGASEMTTTAGSPSLSNIGGLWPAWSLPDGSTTGIGGTRSPEIWSQGTILKARLHLSNTVANNHFVIRFLAATLTDGVVGGSPVALSAESDPYGANGTSVNVDSSTSRGWIVDVTLNLAYSYGDALMWSLQRLGSATTPNNDDNTGAMLVREVEFFFASTGPLNTGIAPAFTANPPTSTPF